VSEASQPTTIDPFIGQTVAGRYTVTACIGRGGMGAVYRARQQPLGRDVALKVIRADLAHDTDLVRRFEREARAIARLADPHIVVVHDFGVSDGVLFLALELLQGVPLGIRLREAGALPLRRALAIARDILVGLDAAHAAGVVHRDLKPDNIMLVRADGRDDYARILDFGIARIVGGPDGTLTSSQVVLGTPGYVAPEVIMGGMSDDPRTDLYAVGIILFEMLTGRAPFVATTPSAILVAQASHDAPPLTSVIPTAPPDVTELVARLTARRADERPASAGDAIARIDAILGGLVGDGAVMVAPAPPRLAPSGQTLILGSSSAPLIAEHDAQPTPRTANLALLVGSVTTPSSMAPVVAPTVTTTPPAPTGAITRPRPGLRHAFAVAAGLAAVVAVVSLSTRGPGTTATPVALAGPASSIPAMSAPSVTSPLPSTSPPPNTPAAPPPLVPPQPTPSEVADLVPAPAAGPAAPTKLAKVTVKPARTTTMAPTMAPTTPATTASPTPVEPAPAGPPPLTSALVKQAFQQSVGKASACANTNIKLASSGPGLFIDHCPSYKTLDGARQVALTVAPDGTVLNARFTDAPTNAHRLGACVLESLKAWKLLPFAGTEPVEILQRVTFEPCIPINGKCVF